MSNSTNGSAHFEASLGTEQLGRDVDKGISHFRRLSDSAVREGGNVENAMLKIGTAIGGAFAISKLKDFASQVMSLRGQIQSLEISFRTLAGATKGDELFQGIREFAVKTPMMLKDLAAGAQTMLAFNIETEKILPLLKALGDVAMGDAQRFNSLSLSFSQMSATGRLMGGDLMQMINAGFNPLAEISRKTGKSIKELKEDMEAGKISTEMVTDAFMSATSEGGKFYGMLEKQSQGITGAVSNLQGAIDDMMNSIGQSSEGAMMTLINAGTSLAKNYEQVGRILLGLIATYGTYKAALIAVTACKGWATTAEALHYHWLLLVEKAQKMLNATMLANPYVLVATLIAGVVAAMVSMKTEEERLKEAEEEYAQQKQRTIEAEQEHKEWLDRLCSVAENEAASTDIRRQALYQLEQKYPEIFAKYQTETEMLADILNIKQQIAEIDSQRSITNPENELTEVEAEMNSLREHGGWGYHKAGQWNRRTRAFDAVPVYSERYQVLMNRRSELRADIRKRDVDNYFTNLTGVSDEDIERAWQVRQNLLARLALSENEGLNGMITGSDIADGIAQTREEIQAQLSALERERNRRTEKATAQEENTDWLASQRQAYRDALNAYNDFVERRTEASRGLTQSEFNAEAERLRALMEQAKKNYDKHKPETDNDSDKAAREARRRQREANRITAENAERIAAIERARQAEIKATRDANLEIEQERINLMDEGTAKSLAQIELDKRRMEAALQDREDALLERYREIKKRQWETEHPKAKDEGLSFDYSSVTKESMIADSQGEGMEWLAEAINAIQESWEIVGQTSTKALERLADQWLETYGDYYQRRQHQTEQWEEILANLPLQYAKMARLQMQAEIGALDMEEIKRQLHWETIFENIDTMSSQALDGFISQLKSYRGAIEQTFDSKTIKEYYDALERLENAKVLTDKKKSVWSSFVPQEFQAAQEAQEKLNRLKERYNALTELQHQKEAEVERKVEDIAAKLKELTGEDFELGDITDPEKLQGTIDALKETNPEGAQSITNLVSDLSNIQGELGGVTEAAGEAGAAVQGMAGAGGGAAQSIAMVGAVVHAINDSVQSAKALIDDLANTAESFGADTSECSGWDTACTVMDGFSEASQGATDAFEAFKSGNPIGVIQGVVKSFTAWIRCFNAIHDKKKERQIQKLQEQIEDLEDTYKRLDRAIDKAFSKDASKLLEQQAQMIQQQRQMIQQQIQLEKEKKNSDKDKIKEWEKELKDLEEDYEDAKEAAIDAIFGEDLKSAIENFADAYAEAWANGEDRATSAKDTVKKMMKQMVQESIKAAIQSSGAMEKIRQKLEQFYADGVLSGWEQDYVLNMAEELQKELDKQFGWADSLLSEDATREGTQKGIATASQDSVDENNARLTTIQGHTYTLVQGLAELNGTANAILDKVAGIEENTARTADTLETVQSGVKRIQNTVEDIQTRGIKLMK